MLLTISTTHFPATDLGYLLHKRPGRLHTVDLAFGKALMFYPEATDARCTFVLALDIDPVALVRGKGKGGDGLLDQYVNDRPYVASSFLSVAMVRGLRTALGGRSAERPELATMSIPLVATVEPLPVRGSEGLIESLFGPLDYQISVTPLPLDETLSELGPDWGASPYVTLKLEATCRLRDLLAHLYVLIPVLDRQKHYFVERGEIEKLLAKGEGWLATHPARELIATRYLRHKRSLTTELFRRLDEEADAVDDVVEPTTALDKTQMPD